VLALLLAAVVSDADARSRDYRSYRFYRNFYEEHKNKEAERPKRRARLPWGEQIRVPYIDCDSVSVNLFGGERRIIKWICINGEE